MVISLYYKRVNKIVVLIDSSLSWKNNQNMRPVMRIQRCRGVGNFLRSVFIFVSPIFKKVVNHKTTKKMEK